MIPALDFSGPGPSLFFLHANGYPPGCYQRLLTYLARHFHVSAMVQRPLWDGRDPQEINDWKPLSSDLLRFLEERHAASAIVVGHSLGGIVTLRAALGQPDRFAAIVLIDPVLFPPRRILNWNWMRLLGKVDRHPLIVGSQNRRQTFDDLDRLFSAYRRRENFRYMNNDALRAYIGSIACPAGDGTYRLCYGVAWETRIYYTGIWRDLDLWRGIPKLKVPTLILRGAETDTFWESSARRVQHLNPAIQVITLDRATHLVPLEKPLETANLIHEFVSATIAANNYAVSNP